MNLATVPDPLDTWPDPRLAGRVAELLGSVSPRVARFAQEHAAGASIIEAARRANLATRNGAPYQIVARPAVDELVRLLREQARRQALLTHTEAIKDFRRISDSAFAAEEWDSSTAALREASKIAGLYPQEGSVGGGGPVQVAVMLALPQRETPPSWLPAAEASPAALPEPAQPAEGEPTP